MYLQTVSQKITEIQKTTSGDIPSISDPECVACLGKGRRPKTDSEVAEDQKIPIGFRKFVLEDRECECINPDRIKYDRDMRTLAFLEKAYKDVGLPIEYEGMCFGNYRGNVDKDYFQFVENRKISVDGVTKYGFMFVGRVGVGKTHLAVSILHGLMIRHHLRCLYVDVAELLTEIRESYNTNRSDGGFSELAIIKRYQRVPVLLIDDISVEKTTEWVRDRMFQIINWRYSNKMITLSTSNDHPERLEEKLGTRTVSRLNGMMDFVEVEGIDGMDQRGRVVGDE